MFWEKEGKSKEEDHAAGQLKKNKGKGKFFRKKKKKSELRCYDYSQKSYFAHEYPKQKKVALCPNALSKINVSNTILLTDSYSL